LSDLYGDALVEAAERVSSREEFAAFVKALATNCARHPDEWDNSTLDAFVQGLAGFVEDVEGYYANSRADINCDLPSWRVFAEMLLAARVYE
jgi:hypothetical protein